MQIDNVKKAIQSLKKVSNDEKYSNFLDSLNFEESKAYLYVEAQRSNMFLKEIAAMKNISISINDLKDKNKQKQIKDLIHNEEYIKNLINFWEMFGNSPAPSINLKKVIIEKYEKYYKPLAEIEKNFIIEC